MFHFNEIGCKIGKSALEKKKKFAHLQQQKKLQAKKKEEEDYGEKEEL